MSIAISELLIKNKILISIQLVLAFIIVVLWSYGDRLIDVHTKIEMTKLLLVQLIGTLIILCIILFVVCLDFLSKIKEQKNEYRRIHISEWRRMVQEISNAHNGSDKPVSYLLERYEAYYSLKPRLSQKTISEIAHNRTVIVGSTIDAALELIIQEIGRIEKEWGLI